MRPLVSVIVPAKDQEAHLADCLTSLVGQLGDPAALEVIVVDDGSRDATGDIARSFESRLPGLQVLRNSSPVGLATARNQGLDRAAGRYLAYLDGDDWLARDHLDRMVEVISRLDVDFVRTDHVQTTDGRRSVVRAPEARRDRVLDPRDSILPMTTSTMVDYCYAWAGIFDRRIAHLLRFPDGLFTAEDRAWCWRLHLQADTYAVVGPPGILYRRGTPTSLTQIHDRRQLDFLPAFELVFDAGASRPRGTALVAESDPDVPRRAGEARRPSASDGRRGPVGPRDSGPAGPLPDPTRGAGGCVRVGQTGPPGTPRPVRPRADSDPAPPAARSGMKQIVVASTFFQCLSLVAAVDANALPDADERILVLADGSRAPELTVPLAEQEGFAVVRSRFDRVVDLAALLYPRRPVQFAPRTEEYPVWEKLLRSHWRLGTGPLQVVLDFIQVNPGYSLAGIFADAELWTHSDGLMTYSPTRRTLPLRLSQRLTGLVHLDLVPGLTPKMLSEHGGLRRTVPLPALGSVLDDVLRDSSSPDEVRDVGRPTALVLGQYLSSLGLMTAAEESELNAALVQEAANRGAEVCVFKPHPAAAGTQTLALAEATHRAGVELVVDTQPEVAELTMRRRRPQWVISCFSTGLATARYLQGVEAVAVGTSALLPRLAPYENSNRVPLVLAEALFHRTDFHPPALAGPTPESRDLQRLVDTVAFCMQPSLHPEGAPEAAAYLELLAREPELLGLFFKRRRLTLLGLPGALPSRTWPSRARRLLSGAPTRRAS